MPFKDVTKVVNLGGYTHENYHLGDEAQWHRGTKGIIERHVKWLKEPRSGIGKFGINVLKAFECSALAISILGIFYLRKGMQYSKTLDSFAEFEKNKSSTTRAPPFKTVEKTSTTGFNHVNYYAIYDNALWFKSKENPEASWEMFYFDGLPKGRLPVELSVDGANLAIKDDKGFVHYKKVLRERRLNNGDEEIYQYMDLTLKNNWKEMWFSLPFISKLVNYVKEKITGDQRVQITGEVEDWCMSHRGQYNRHYEDQAGTRHAVEVGVTELCCLFKGCNDVFFADPWLPFGFKRKLSELNIGLSHRMEGPKDSNFEAKKIDISASMIVLTGYGQTPEGQKMKVYTRLGDFDTDARNPFLKYTDKPEETIEDLVRYNKPAPWILQPDFPNGAVITGDKVTISQTGVGNAERLLEIKGINLIGKPGHYWKKVFDLQWQFKPD